jgi:hypothetical protein
LFEGNLAKWLSNYKKDGEVIILLVKATWKHRVGSIIPSFIIPSFHHSHLDARSVWSISTLLSYSILFHGQDRWCSQGAKHACSLRGLECWDFA